MARSSMRRQTLAALVAAVLALPTLASQVNAQDYRERDRERFDRRETIERHGPPEHRFADRDWERWRGGRWYHGPHAGREGWWWVAGGAWYFYPAPVYPYPDPYALPVISAPPASPSGTVTPAPAQQQCREYQGDAIINGNNQPFYGTACLEADGQWHIVSQ